MLKRTKPPETIADAIRRVIREAEGRGITRYRIAKLARMPQSQIGRIASGESVPTVITAERIVNAIGLRIIVAE